MNKTELFKNLTFADLTLKERRGTLMLFTTADGSTYAISNSRLRKSACEPTTELFISKDSNWLIPADTASESIDPDW